MEMLKKITSIGLFALLKNSSKFLHSKGNKYKFER